MLGAELSRGQAVAHAVLLLLGQSEYRILRLAELPRDDAAVPGSHGQRPGGPLHLRTRTPDQCTERARSR
ncbi:hypothetical protein QJS66_07265 [Kocuria rhizophila]|nr:hypothetical protein QJS66_07265 [Kocuria rhizophila]